MESWKRSSKNYIDYLTKYGFTSIVNLNEAYKVLSELIVETNGMLKVEFLDSGNWDYLSSVEKDGENGFLQLNWKDFRVNKSKERDDMSGAILLSLLVKFKELRIVDIIDHPVIFLRGFSVAKGEIKKYLSNKGTNLQIGKSGAYFYYDAAIKVDDNWEVYDCYNFPIFSIMITTNFFPLHTLNIKKLIALYNHRMVQKEIFSQIEIITGLKDSMEDEICEKSNTIRRKIEYILKVEICYYFLDKHPERDLKDLKLGELKSLISTKKTVEELKILKRMISLSNELSHDSGFPITLEKLLLLLRNTNLYILLSKRKIESNFYPSKVVLNRFFLKRITHGI